jgi:hypothetical protein
MGVLARSHKRTLRDLRARRPSLIRKSSRGRYLAGVRRSASVEVTDALIWLHDKDVVRWTWIVDETPSAVRVELYADSR